MIVCIANFILAAFVIAVSTNLCGKKQVPNSVYAMTIINMILVVLASCYFLISEFIMK